MLRSFSRWAEKPESLFQSYPWSAACRKNVIIVISSLCRFFSGISLFRTLVYITKFLNWFPSSGFLFVAMYHLYFTFDAEFDDFNAIHHKVQHKEGKCYLDSSYGYILLRILLYSGVLIYITLLGGHSEICKSRLPL